MKMKCSKCGREEEETDMNEGTICDECYVKYEKIYKVSSTYLIKIDFGLIKAFSDEEAIAIAEDKYKRGKSVDKILIDNKTYELINMKTGNRIMIGE